MESESGLPPNEALGVFITMLGYDPVKVISQLSDTTNDCDKMWALHALKVERDFSNTCFTSAGIEWAKSWLDSLMLDEHRTYQRCRPCPLT
ncbi:hypothetical protein [Chromobacterium haemolyticum]|uniref:hypothetical protein n=1 Tax=Chromobacterium haemolyticum TaxID=394935 RepID=UPI00244BB9F9|nr:hypothetical protein [Chromobacterium haemolyticum]MDH0342069.1 hypothetical protein [Chromobacterium haemolyticum]